MSTRTTSDHLLREAIALFNAGFAQSSPELAKTIDKEIREIIRSGAGSNAPRPGDFAPPFTLPDAQGGQVALHDLLARGALVVVFYRGEWCPYCNLALRAMQQVLRQIQALGANLVAISPQTPDESLTTAEKKGLSFAVLSDAGNRVARSYGLVFKLSHTLDAIQQSFSIDLARSNGNASKELPVPGTFVVGRDGRIVSSFVDADYRLRVEPAEILRQLEILKAQPGGDVAGAGAKPSVDGSTRAELEGSSRD